MACVMQLWDEGHAYDDPDCVLCRLMTDAAAAAVVTTDKSTSNDSEFRDSGRDEPPEQQTKTTAPRSTNIELKPVAQFTIQESVTVVAAGQDIAPLQASHQSSQQAQYQALLASLPARLELAASHADLTESLSALCSWAALVTSTAAAAASVGHQHPSNGSSNGRTSIPMSSNIDADAVREAEAYRDASIDAFFRSQALEILLRHVFSRPDRLMDQLPVVQAGLTSLLRHLLRPVICSNGDDVASGALLRGLEGTLSQLRDIHELKMKRRHQQHGGADANTIIDDNTIALLVQRVCAAVRSAHHHSASSWSVGHASSSSNAPTVRVVVRSPVEVLREIDEQLCQVSAAMDISHQPATATSTVMTGQGQGPSAVCGTVELQQSLVLREMASDKLALLLQASKQIYHMLTSYHIHVDF